MGSALSFMAPGFSLLSFPFVFYFLRSHLSWALKNTHVLGHQKHEFGGVKNVREMGKPLYTGNAMKSGVSVREGGDSSWTAEQWGRAPDGSWQGCLTLLGSSLISQLLRKVYDTMKVHLWVAICRKKGNGLSISMCGFILKQSHQRTLSQSLLFGAETQNHRCSWEGSL